MTDEQRVKFRALITRRSAPANNGKGCRFWGGGRGSHGYGNIRVGDRVMTSAKVTFEAFHRDLEPGEVPRHTCDIKLCVEPNHLIPGTQLENADDYKRRRASSKKLTPEIVTQIRRRAKNGVSARVIGKLYGVCHKMIQNIVDGRAWTHV